MTKSKENKLTQPRSRAEIQSQSAKAAYSKFSLWPISQLGFLCQNTMKILSQKFSKLGFDFEQIKRSGRIALFRKSKRQQKPTFEVIRVGSHGDYMLSGDLIPASETYPHSEAWGSDGFTFNDEDRAASKFNQMAGVSK